MWINIVTGIKSFFTWLYNWVTVIAAIVIAGLMSIVDQIDQFAGIQWSAFVTQARAAQIVAGVAVLKAITALLVTLQSKFKGQ